MQNSLQASEMLRDVPDFRGKLWQVMANYGFAPLTSQISSGKIIS